MKKVFLILSLSALGQAHGFALFKNSSQHAVRVAVSYPLSGCKSCPDELFDLKPNETHKSPPQGDGCRTCRIAFTLLHDMPEKHSHITGNFNNHEFEITDKTILLRREGSSVVKKRISFKDH